ncbi:hypothetical protein A3A93_05105 [Candidatus Roizmanbacteria bacterium RIFCSPLOWO2_01_FULL_38_12]|uniref:Glycosyltransferase 2-like domain-containing protein n=1 Tax=Candidatus Roizmanbacteria bacterium RIFCSPLOWO2_01_FULL_38_12 TaxID=1802061 RepID=A0A1F7IQX7_9BACT|nr:MAG: hypothetical protein A2861_02540 [Candidatus Roizmanbacteria bacterium RIFCSPHIGHO2_01_FULL_38_15]OGK35993.1 MAG: hypothetical protein A3F59_05430 [Candidatus Roizmanbacteria bacterium RIFCSPHIGHO2_12_FULL_38_13]OGK45770.1 MAG: hypothetical protein A3A93_05105 [Candidatus Roizmanbacteria bacterium RIFCSPLOWO2_01_FULL_38_12]
MLSLIIPFHNEKENLSILLSQIHESLKNHEYEVVLVDDGSTDQSSESIKDQIDSKKVYLVKMGRQMGKGKALSEGIEHSHGEYIVFMDADLQDDPADIHNFVNKLNEDHDLVNGVRHNRQDNIVIKLYSSLAGWFLKSFLHSPFSDINCGFKIFRKKLVKDITLYGNNFRFFPLAAYYEGYKVAEVPVNNRPRLHGTSKYGITKVFIGLIDMLSAYFLYKFAERPLHFFGFIGSIFFLLGSFIIAIVTYQRIFEGILLYRRPVLQYGIFLLILGVQIIATGILGELMVYLHNKRK